jgi:acyl-CoA synthetase (AMP-forming)/AMP-acid ligase II
LGQGIVLICSPSPASASPASAGEVAQSAGEGLISFLKSRLPNFMVPHHIAWLPDLPRNPNGKFDRPALAAQFRDTFPKP